MQPMRLAGCLLLFAAVAAAREIPASAFEIANLPAELQVQATNCLKLYGVAGCKWGAAACRAVKPTIGSCQLCQAPEAGKWECVSCVPGNYKNGDDCSNCPKGAWCGGSHEITWCDEPYIVNGGNIYEGLTTFTNGSWSSAQCSTCLPGYYKDGNLCSQCSAGMFKPRIGSEACSWCPDGYIANMQAAATECVPYNQAKPPTLDAATTDSALWTCPPGSAQGPVLSDPTIRSCVCNSATPVVTTFGNKDVFGTPSAFPAKWRTYTSAAIPRLPSPWPILCAAAPPPPPATPATPPASPSPSPRPEWGHWQHGKKDKHGHKLHKEAYEHEEWEWAKDDDKDYYGYESGKYEDKHDEKWEKKADKYEHKHHGAHKKHEHDVEKWEEKEEKEEEKWEKKEEKKEKHGHKKHEHEHEEEAYEKEEDKKHEKHGHKKHDKEEEEDKWEKYEEKHGKEEEKHGKHGKHGKHEKEEEKEDKY